MSPMPTLHVRDVPVEVYEALRRRAERNGRSINAETIEILKELADGEGASGDWLERLRELRERIDFPPDAPKPEEIIRRDRDSR